MHPAVASVWQRVFAGHGYGGEGWSCGPGRGGWGGACGPGQAPVDEGGEGSAGGGGGGWDDGGGGFGVRRPLRFLAYKLELDERQVAELARILNELKTERAQAEVDRRRSVAAFADAIATDGFDSAKAAEAGAVRVQSAERLRDAVTKALQQIHGVLQPEQRSRLAYLIRTGTLVI
jgi:Spy/CpxP family protein refolding chaperone